MQFDNFLLKGKLMRNENGSRANWVKSKVEEKKVEVE